MASWRLAGLPKALTPAGIQALFASCDRRTPTGRRDFVVLTTLVRLGLRAGELAALRLDDIDWRVGAIVIRGKGHQVEQLPWPADVGEAVVAYLRRGRATTAIDRTVFVRIGVRGSEQRARGSASADPRRRGWTATDASPNPRECSDKDAHHANVETRIAS